jgi:dihydroorotate dehydrogenase electron transfer subunit
MNALAGSPDDCGPGGRQRADDAEAMVLANRPAADGYRLMTVRAGAAAATARPGQFFQLECPPAGDDRPYFRRPMSLYRADADGGVEFLYKVTGSGTRALARLGPGDQLRVLGPLGRGFALPPAARAVVLLGRGVGIATLAPLADAAAAAGLAVTALISARSPAHLLAADRLAAAGAAVVPLFDSDGGSAPARVERLLADLFAAGRLDVLYTCGSARLVALAQHLGRRLGFAGEVALEQQMACGLGMCFACVRDFVAADGGRVSRRVCWDGPVFPLDEVVP